MRVYPVILCGGSGTRLWPTSRPSAPKQFAPLLGAQSLFEEAVVRLARIEGAEPPVIVAGAAHLDLIRTQLDGLNTSGQVLLEPEGRDSAPAIAAAAAWIHGQDPDGVAVVVASDHYIPDSDAFCATVAKAVKAASTGKIVMFGIRPTAPVTAYGYLEAGGPVDGADGLLNLQRFVEKPDAARARAYVEAGYLWNSGNFVFAAATMLEELARFAPAVADAAQAAISAGRSEGGATLLSPDFLKAPKISIDYAVMEKTDRAVIVPASFAWSDLGAWDAVLDAAPRDASGNAAFGDVRILGGRDVLARSDGPLVVTVGVSRVAVVASPDAVLVCGLDHAQDVKQAVELLKRQGRREVDTAEPAALSLSGDAASLRRWMLTSALPLWWTLGADHAVGGFYESIDQAGEPVLAKRRARVQARQIYVYAAAGRLGWKGPWAQAVEHGLTFFIDRYRRADGQFRTLVDPLGGGSDDAATLYDQAFALLALASAAQALPQQAARCRQIADELLHALRETRAHASGGFLESTGLSPYQSNPHMHLLEASLAWIEIGGGEAWTGLAENLVALCSRRFIDPDGGFLREFFAPDWTPAAGEPGRLAEPGHQFEWAWLLDRWGALAGDRKMAGLASRLFEFGERYVDPAHEVAVNAVLDDGAVHDPAARLWPQTERIKAAHRLGRDASLASACRGLSKYLETPVPGLWRDRLLPNGRFIQEPAPASSFYHLVCALAELD